MKSDAHWLLEQHLQELGIKFMPEFVFHEDRKWRFDYVLERPGPIVVEIEGGIWTRGRHTRGKGFLGDMEKYNFATMMGYLVLRFSTQQVLDGTAREFIKEHCL